MRDQLTPFDIANDIRLTRAQHAGAFLIVEGERTDLRLFRHLIALESCQLVAAHSKLNAIDTLAMLEQADFPGVLAIVDADFWRLDGKTPASGNLLITDTHDLETMMLLSPALDKLLDEFGSSGKIRKLTERRGQSIREILLDGARAIGYLRWISRKCEIGLTFEQLTFSRFTDTKCLRVDMLKLVKAVKDKSCRHDLDVRVLCDAIEEATDPGHDPWDVCCGHDLICILSEGLKKAIGSNNASDVKPQVLERALRMAYEFAHFSATQLCESLRCWESCNQPFAVLPSPRPSVAAPSQ